MAYIQVEASVRTHKKFLKAGPAASWLWLCGMGYCQDGLTDGFIPMEALDFLGVKNPARLATQLVLARLWDALDDGSGWRVHDYLEHNKPASEIERVKRARRAGGAQGGRPIKEPPVEPSRLPSEGNHPENPSLLCSATPTATASASTTTHLDAPPMDVWARELVNLYPAQGRCGWNQVERPLYDALDRQHQFDFENAWEWLKTRLEQHTRSHQWAMKGMIPRLDKWLREGLYLQELPEAPPVAEQLGPKTTRMFSAASTIMKERA